MRRRFWLQIYFRVSEKTVKRGQFLPKLEQNSGGTFLTHSVHTVIAGTNGKITVYRARVAR